MSFRFFNTILVCSNQIHNYKRMYRGAGALSTKMDTWDISGIEISVVRKKIKNIHIRVHPPYGNVTVSAPAKVSDETILSFVSSKIDWIKKHQKKFQQQEVLINQYVSGEMINVWGKKCHLTVLHSEISDVIHNGDDVILLTDRNNTFEERKNAVYEWYKDLMNIKISETSAKWEDIIGVKADRYVVKDMKSKWGTCNISNKKICLNIQLAKKDPECFEYVLVHELCHLLEGSHNHVFKAYMDKYLPDWRDVKKLLDSQAIGTF